jgi:hypothetical protein
MRSFVRLAALLLTLLVLAGCDTKPKPADTPKQLMEPPGHRPVPSGGGKPAQTSQIALTTWMAA